MKAKKPHNVVKIDNIKKKGEICCLNSEIPGNLTPLQQEIYNLHFLEHMPAKQISLRRGTKRQAVDRIIRDLKKKGHVVNVVKDRQHFTPHVSMRQHIPVISGEKRQHISPRNNHAWRFHGLHFVVKPYYFFPRYHKIRQKLGNYAIPWRDWEIKLHSEMIEIQLKSGRDFASKDKWEALRKANDSFSRSLFELSEKYGFAVWKEGKANIRLVNQHLASNPSDIARASKANYIALRGVDNKIYFTFDKSKGLEHEYRHPEEAVVDSEKIEPYIDDWRYRQPPTNTELAHMMKEIIRINKDTAGGLNAVVTFIKSQLPEKKDQAHSKKSVPEYIG